MDRLSIFEPEIMKRILNFKCALSFNININEINIYCIKETEVRKDFKC